MSIRVYLHDMPDLMDWCVADHRYGYQIARVLRDRLNCTLTDDPMACELCVSVHHVRIDTEARVRYFCSNEPFRDQNRRWFTRYLHHVYRPVEWVPGDKNRYTWVPFPVDDGGRVDRKLPWRMIYHGQEEPRQFLTAAEVAFARFKEAIPELDFVTYGEDDYGTVLSALAESEYYLCPYRIVLCQSKSVLESLVHRCFVLAADPYRRLEQIYGCPTVPVPMDAEHMDGWTDYLLTLWGDDGERSRAMNRAYDYVMGIHAFDVIARRLTSLLQTDNLL